MQHGRGVYRYMENRIRELREKRGMSQQALGDRVGTTRQQIHKIETGAVRLTVDWMVRLAPHLGVDPKDLMLPTIPDSLTRPQEQSPQNNHILSSLPQSLGARLLPNVKGDLPILGSAQGGRRGVLMIPVEQRPVDWTLRPPQLEGVGDAFSIIVYDDSMYPMYRPGQIAWVHPHLPINPGDGALVILNSDEALIKMMVRRTDAATILREFNPEPREFSLKPQDIRIIYRILGAIDPR